MQNFIIVLMNKYGYPGIFFLITIENLFPPIPSEVILTLGGFMTTYTSLHVIGVIFFSTLGSLFGAILLYFVGKLISPDRLLKFAAGKTGKILHLKAADIAKSITWFQKKGNKTVLYCRFVPILRSLISIPAGMSGMKQSIFLMYTTIGSVIWNSVLIILGRLVGNSWQSVTAVIAQYSFFTKTLLLLLCLIAVASFYKKRFQNKKSGSRL